MTPHRPARPPVRFDALPVSAALGAVAGALAIAVPYFNGLAAALGGLTLGTWLLRGGPRGPFGYGDRRRPPILAFASGLGAWGLFLVPPPFLLPYRGLVLGAAGLVLWWTRRAPPRFGGG